MLREAIRQILREGADSGKIYNLVEMMKQINSKILSNHVSKGFDRNQAPVFGVLLQSSGDPMVISFAVMGIDEDGNLRPDHVTPMEESDTAYLMEDHIGITVPWGAIRFGSQRSSCSGAMAVQTTYGTKSGWGPLLYDLAIEYSTQEAGGLISDRGTVSPDARAVWGKYFSSRGDVEKAQMDNIRSPITPVIEDDCNQQPAEVESHDTDAWLKSPLSKAYRKNTPVAMNYLESRGMLFQS